MKLKLSVCKLGFLMPDTTAKEKEYDITTEELTIFQNGFLFLYELENGDINKIFKEEEYKLHNLEKSKQEKSEAINKRATLSDQLNTIASVLDTITSDKPDQAIIDNAKAMFKDIKGILNK